MHQTNCSNVILTEEKILDLLGGELSVGKKGDRLWGSQKSRFII
jgi:hypothetical protein